MPREVLQGTVIWQSLLGRLYPMVGRMVDYGRLWEGPDSGWRAMSEVSVTWVHPSDLRVWRTHGRAMETRGARFASPGATLESFKIIEPVRYHRSEERNGAHLANGQKCFGASHAPKKRRVIKNLHCPEGDDEKHPANLAAVALNLPLVHNPAVSAQMQMTGGSASRGR